MLKSILLKHHNIFILQDYLLSLVIFLCPIFSGIISQNASAEETSEDTICCQCHNNICEDAIGMYNAHRPFLQKQCSTCHVCDDTDVEERGDTTVVEEGFGSYTNNVTWLDYRLSDGLEHWFIIPFDLINTDKLVVCAYDIKNKSHRKTLLLPAIETIQFKENDTTAPVIESFEVVGVYQGVLISAQINWLTDKESNSEIRYGIDTLEHSVKADNFTTEHKIVLQSLEANQIYQYKVISRDIFDNMTESGIALFSTEKFSQHPSTGYEQYQINGFQLDTQFFQNGDSYIIKFNANLPIKLSVGTQKTNNNEPVPKAAKVNTPTNHSRLRSRDKISLSVCTKKCHVGFTHSNSHPVGVSPPENAIVPTAYSLRSDGHITCVTCHASHASNYDSRLRFRYKNGKIKAGCYADIETARSMGGCLVCHPSKGVIPKKRLPPGQGFSTRNSVLSRNVPIFR